MLSGDVVSAVFHSSVAVFEAAVAALRAEAWDAMATFVDPVSLRGFSRELLERVAPRNRPRSMTVEQYLAHDPQMPRAVAEYYVEQGTKHSQTGSILAREFPGVASAEMLAPLSPEAVFARWVAGKSMRSQFQQLVEAGQIAGDVAAHRATLPFSHAYDYIVLGSVADGEQLAHVLYRRDVAPPDTWTGQPAEWFRGRSADEQALVRDVSGREHPWVATCRRQADQSWRLIADHDFLHVSSIQLTGVGMHGSGDTGAAP
jgi:hypothetical protein